MLVISPLSPLFFFVFVFAGLCFLMRRFWSCFTSVLLSSCLCVCARIGIPAYSTFLSRNWLPLMGQGKPLKGKLWLPLVFFSPYLFLPPPTLCFLLVVLNSSHSISLWIALLLLFSVHSLFLSKVLSLAFLPCLRIILNKHTHICTA